MIEELDALMLFTGIWPLATCYTDGILLQGFIRCLPYDAVPPTRSPSTSDSIGQAMQMRYDRPFP